MLKKVLDILLNKECQELGLAKEFMAGVFSYDTVANLFKDILVIEKQENPDWYAKVAENTDLPIAPLIDLGAALQNCEAEIHRKAEEVSKIKNFVGAVVLAIMEKQIGGDTINGGSYSGEVKTSFGAKAKLKISTYASPENPAEWNYIFKSIVERGHFELLRKQLNSTPYQALLDEGKSIPGLKVFEKRSVVFSRRVSKN